MYLDMIVGVVIVISILFGIKNGFVVEFISTFGVVINFLITQKVTPMVLKYVEKYLVSNYTYTYVIVFVLVFIIFSILIHILNLILKKQSVSFISRILGGILSFVKGFIISALVLLIFNITADSFPKIKEYGKDSRANAYFLEESKNVDQYIPEFFKEKLKMIRDNRTIDKYIDKLF
ncbi:CvpA family protein [Fusobacterium sp.]|uniref:CvpA family protein n=1 Tax=Fusobacterium sp. TaxID=68766 RepID=UPI0026130A90|nr:CvpA family protein [Fusobacterium sp.]